MYIEFNIFEELNMFLKNIFYGIGIFIAIICLIIIVPYLMKFIASKMYRIPKIITSIKMSKRQKNINFDEFSDIENVYNQEQKYRENLEHEYTVLEKIYRDSFRDENNDGIIDNIHEVNDNIKEAKENLYNFKVLDSVKVKKQKIVEGAKLDDIKQNQKDFDLELFKNWSMQIFSLIKIGNEKELEVIKKVMTNQMYNNFVEQLKEFENDGLKFITEDLNIKDVSLYDYRKAMSKEEIQILVTAKMKEYIIDKNTDTVLRGNRKKSYEKKVLMTFLKQNKEDEEGFITNCPNCSAATTQVQFGKCEYCGTLVFPIRYNWTLIKFETI